MPIHSRSELVAEAAPILNPIGSERRRAVSDQSRRTDRKIIGLLAGSGRFPMVFAESAKRQGYEVACVGIRHEASQELESLCSQFRFVGVSKLGGMIRAFKAMNAREIVMAGKVTKSVMHTPLRIVRLLPDLRFLKFWFGRLRDKKDDSILLGVIAEFERDGLVFSSALDYCPELLVKQGILTKRTPTPAELRDVEFGWRLAKAMGGLDVGQSVCVKEQAVLAVEAIEGTDRCVERAGTLCRSGGWTLVKVAKPQQDMRFDVPTVGLSTVENLRRAGGRVLAIEAGKTIVIDQDDVIARANALGLSIVACDGADMAVPPLATGD
jgi:hypothetical protein